MSTKRNPNGKHIYGLHFENILSIAGLTLSTEDGTLAKINKITAPNASGKTAFLEGLKAVFLGKGDCSDIVRIDEETATAAVSIGRMSITTMDITRTMGADGSNKPKIKVHEGVKPSSVQAFLAELVHNNIIFNPAAFVLASPEDRQRMVLEAIPVKVTRKNVAEWFPIKGLEDIDTNGHGLFVLKAIEDRLYDNRRDANRDTLNAENALTVLREKLPPDYDPKVFENWDVSALQAEQQEAGRLKEDKRQKALSAEKAAARARELRVEKDGLLRRLSQLDTEIDELDKQAAGFTAQAEEIVIPDDEQARLTLDRYTDAKVNYDHWKQAMDAQKEYDKRKAYSDQLGELLERARQLPMELLKQSEVPVAGLEIAMPEPGDRKANAVTITMNGKALHRLSTSEQARLGLSIAKAIAGDLRVVLWDRWEMFDLETTLALWDDMMKDDFQYFIADVAQTREEMEAGFTVSVDGKLPGMN